MKASLIIAPIFFLAACTTGSAPDSAGQNSSHTPEIGTTQWFELVESQYPTSDGQGHGPDYGSQEWCDVVYFKMHGQRAATPVSCDQQWFESIDKKLHK